MVFMAMADKDEFEIVALDARCFHHVNQVLSLAKPAGIYKKRFVGQNRIIPGRP